MGFWLLHAAFRVTLSEKASGLETKSALKLMLCFLWLGFKRGMSAEPRRSPFAYLGSSPLWKNVWEGSSMLRAGPRVTTVIPIHCHPPGKGVGAGVKRESPACSIYLDVSWLDLKRNEWVPTLYILTLGVAVIFCVGALKYVSLCPCMVQHLSMGGEPRRVLVW